MKIINLILGTVFCVSLAFASSASVTPAAGTVEPQLLNGGPIPPPWDLSGENQLGGPIPPPWDLDSPTLNSDDLSIL